MTCCVVLSTSSTICELTMPESLFFTATAEDFKKIPGSPVAYWTNRTLLLSFQKFNQLEKVATTRKGMVTANNTDYVRLLFEISEKNLDLINIKIGN